MFLKKEKCAGTPNYYTSLSRQALYLRLIPRRADSNEVKRHVRTVPASKVAQTKK